MRAIELQNCFGIDSLVETTRPDPQPGAGEVLVKMRMASLNYRDLLVVKGLYNPSQPVGFIPVSDGVGEVIALGEGVTRFAMGDRVMGQFVQSWIDGDITREKAKKTLGAPLDGVMSEFRLFPEDGLVAVPDYLSDEGAATLPIAALTAWTALTRTGGLLPGETVLVQGTGGVSLFALQFARMMGARVIVTSGHDDKLQRALAMGADHGIQYNRQPDWEREVLTITQGQGVDHIVEVGGAKTLAHSLNCVRYGGHIHVIGILSGMESSLSVIPILMKNVRINGIYVGSRHEFEQMNRALVQHQLQPVVDRVFAFGEIREAFRYMERGAHFGKICIRIG
jgi:NADPH:quinone reductase-like Zn-dependent oxidoreductase